MRRGIFILFVICFIAGSIPLLLYAQGWRFNAQTKRLEHAALLVLKNSQKSISIMIDNIEQSPLGGRSQTIVRGIMPGTHTITVSKPGYITWQTTLAFQPGVTTFIDTVHLVPMELPTLTPLPLSPRTTVSLITEDAAIKLLATDDEQSVLYSLAIGQENPLTRIATFHEPVLFAGRQKNILLFRSAATGSSKSWFEVTDGKTQVITDLFPVSLQSAVIPPKQNHMLYALEPQRLLLLNRGEKTMRQLFTATASETFTDIAPAEEYLYLTVNDTAATYLVVLRYLPDGRLEEFARFPLPHMQRPLFDNTVSSSSLAIFDQPTGLLSLAQLQNGVPHTIVTLFHARGILATANDLQRLWWKEKDIWLIDDIVPQRTPLLSFNTPIKKIIADTKAMTFYSVFDSAVTAADLVDSRHAVPTAKLFDFDVIADAALSPQGDYLIAIGKNKASEYVLITRRVK